MLHNYNVKLYEPRKGLLLHYDDSTSDPGAVEWLTRDPKCKVSYNRLYLDNGSRVNITPTTARAWHAGVCRPSDPRLPYKDANSAFYGWAIATNDNHKVTPAAYAALLEDATELFKEHGWREAWRVTTHHLEAWPRGRKIDIEGDPRKPTYPIFDLQKFRMDLAGRLR